MQKQNAGNATKPNRRTQFITGGMGLGLMLGRSVKWIPGAPVWAPWAAGCLGAVVGGAVGFVCEIAYRQVVEEQQGGALSIPDGSR